MAATLTQTPQASAGLHAGRALATASRAAARRAPRVPAACVDLGLTQTSVRECRNRTFAILAINVCWCRRRYQVRPQLPCAISTLALLAAFNTCTDIAPRSGICAGRCRLQQLPVGGRPHHQCGGLRHGSLGAQPNRGPGVLPSAAATRSFAMLLLPFIVAFVPPNTPACPCPRHRASMAKP